MTPIYVCSDVHTIAVQMKVSCDPPLYKLYKRILHQSTSPLYRHPSLLLASIEHAIPNRAPAIYSSIIWYARWLPGWVVRPPHAERVNWMPRGWLWCFFYWNKKEARVPASVYKQERPASAVKHELPASAVKHELPASAAKLCFGQR